MLNFDDVTIEEAKEHKLNYTEVSDHPYKILITGCSGWGKTNLLFNLINQQRYFDEICLYDKDSNEAKDKYVKILKKSFLIIINCFLNTRIIWIILIKTLKNAIQIKNINY